VSEVKFDFWTDDGTVWGVCRKCGMREDCPADKFKSREEAVKYFQGFFESECPEYEGNTYREEIKDD
jgi:hypothetical protein